MLLTSTKSEIDRLLGKPVMGRNIFGLAGERVFKYRQGDFDIVVGFLNEVARYCASVRRSGPLKELSPPELAIVLSLNAPAALWTIEMAETPASTTRTTARGRTAKTTQPLRTTYLRYVKRDPKVKDKVTSEILGWMPARKAYAFFCLPAMDGQPPLLASEWAVNQALA
jgi:hypothetical protein